MSELSTWRLSWLSRPMMKAKCISMAIYADFRDGGSNFDTLAILDSEHRSTGKQTPSCMAASKQMLAALKSNTLIRLKADSNITPMEIFGRMKEAIAAAEPPE